MSQSNHQNMETEILFDPNSEPQDTRLAQLKQLFPDCFDKNGVFLAEKMAQALRTSDIDTSKEYYTMNWLGKSYAKVLRDLPPETLLAENHEHNSKPEHQNSQNLLIKGDNLEVLKHLTNAYKGAVKMIYIDPPYNTGTDGFVYQDDRKFTAEQLVKLGGMDLDEAQRVLDFTAKKSNSHSAWLTFMYPRLYIARELLKDDGVIFISIDDNEQAQLKLLCDEVFGEENFVAEIIVEGTPKNDPYIVSTAHEYCFVYTKNFDIAKAQNYGVTNPFYIKILDIFNQNLDKSPDEIEVMLKTFYRENNLSDDNIANYKYCDEFGIFRTGPIDDPQSSGAKDIRINPKTGNPCKIPSRGWSCSIETWEEWKKSNLIYFPDNDSKLPSKKTYIEDGRLDVLRAYFKIQTRKDTDNLKKMFGTPMTVFSNPKPLDLIKAFLSISQDDNFIAMDFFAGSGTTAEAIFQLNTDNKNRKFILVQLPENLDETLKTTTGKGKKIIQTAIKYLDEHNKPHHLFEITKARIEKAAEKIQADNPDYQGDLGFKIFETVEDFRTLPELNDNSQQKALLFPDLAHLDDEQIQTLLTTWRVYDGQKLPENIHPINLGGYTAYLCDKHLYLLHNDFASAHIKALLDKLDEDKTFVIERIVLLGDAIDSAKQQELNQAIKTYANKKSLNISVLVRY